MEKIRVYAPATVANVACGFDIFGFAVNHPGDEVVLVKKDSPGIEIIEITGMKVVCQKMFQKIRQALPFKSFLNL